MASSGSPLSVASKLGMTLRWLAGGSYLDVAIIFGVSSKMFTAYVTPVLLAIRDNTTMEFPLENPTALEQLELGFRATSWGRMKGCVAAGDAQTSILAKIFQHC